MANKTLFKSARGTFIPAADTLNEASAPAYVLFTEDFMDFGALEPSNER